MTLENVNEVKEFTKNFYKYLDFSTAKLIEHILSYDHLPSKTEIARDLDIPSYTLSRKLNYLKRLGVAFGVNLDFLSIGLKKLIVIARNYLELNDVIEKEYELSRFLNFYAPILLPFQGTLLVYYIPTSIDVHKLVSKLTSTVKDINTYDVIIKSIYSKAKLTHHFDFTRKEYRIDWKRLYRLSSGTALTSKDIADRLIDESCKSVKFDLLDLLIIDQLETDPFKHVMNISKELGVSYAKVLRHFNQHVSRIVKGFRLRLVPLPPESSLYVCVRVGGNYGLLRRLANALSELVFIAGIHLSSQNFMYVLAVVSSDVLNNLIKFLGDFRVDYDVYLLDRMRRVVYSLPYTEYSRFLKGWTV